MAKSIGNSALGKGSDFFDEKHIYCQPCSVQGKGDIPAKCFCVDCQEYLCKPCSTSHKAMKALQNHVLVAIAEAKEKVVPMVTKDTISLKCTVHNDKNIKYFCVSHAYLGCSVCITMDHKQCTNVDYIPAVAKDIRNNDDFKKFDERLKALETACKTGILDVKINLENIKSDEHQMKEAIKQFRKQLNDALDKYENEMTEKAEAISSEETKKLNVLSKELSHSLANTSTLVEKVDTLLSIGKNCDAYVLIKKEADQLVSLENELTKAVQDKNYQRYEFLLNNDILNAATLGKLSIRSETVSFSAAVTALVHKYMVKLLRKGTRVRRGKDLDSNDQDGGGQGTIIGQDRCPGWYKVKLDHGYANMCRMGAFDNYDLEIV